MTQVHAAVGSVLLGAAVLFTLAAAIAARAGGASWLEGARVVVTSAMAIQVTLGVVSYLGEGRPATNLHLVYGVIALGTLPFASFFAAEAPPAARAKVLVVAGLVTTGLVWRLAATG